MPDIANESTSFLIKDTSQVGEARRAAIAMGHAIKLDELRCGQAAIVVTELATNLARHAKGGQLILRIDRLDGELLEVLAVDRGPGMANVALSQSDGHSSGSTAGTGLGAIKRQSNEFDLFTSVPAGTVIMARIGMPRKTLPRLEMGVVSRPHPAEKVNGDSWHAEATSAERTVVLIADGLGHGLNASTASQLAQRLFRENLQQTAGQIVTLIHAGLRSTRGAAVAVAEIRHRQGQVIFAGLGNISASVFIEGKIRSMVSHNGTAGVEARRIQEFTYPWEPTSRLFMHSDGLTTHWQLSQYVGLRMKHPAVIAGVLFRDHRRERDDTTVLVLGEKKSA